MGILRPSRIQSKRISKTPSRSGPTNVFGRMIDDVEAAPAELTGQLLGLDLRLAVPADADERVVLVDRVALGHAVDGGRRDQDHTPDACLERGAEDGGGALDVDRADRRARRLDRQCRRGVDDDVGARHELARVPLGANVAAHLLDTALELAVVERGNVQRADRVALRERSRARWSPRKPAPPEIETRVTRGG